MKKRMVWLLVSCLMVAALLLASCAAAEEEEEVVIPEEEEEVVVVEEEEVVAPAPEGPQYGGVINLRLAEDILGFDEIDTGHYAVTTVHLTNEELLQGDWARGPAGTNEADWLYAGANRAELKTGAIAESWEIPEKGTMVFRIRKGVHYALDPSSEASRLVNGRELTADDVVFSLKRLCEAGTRSYIRAVYAGLADSVEITAPDEWTVVVKCPPEEFGNSVSMFPDFASIVPPEVVEEYGDMTDWRNSCGTGAFMLTDFVPGSGATVIRNDNYWEKDPIGPGKGNQLPYVDEINILVIPDVSTSIAALRTGKIDTYYASWEDALDIIETSPELIYSKNLTSDGCLCLYMRQDDPEMPFSDVRVRRALMLAINHPEIRDEYYGGEAEILNWPVAPVREYIGAYLPLEELPESTQELYGHDPDKAKQLLAEAGYPDGFKTNILCGSAATYVDVLSMVAAYWAEIGVELELDTREWAVINSLGTARRYKELLYFGNSGIGTYYKMINFNGVSSWNGSYVDDAHVKEVHAQMTDLVGMDEAKMMELNRELMPYVLEQAWVISMPTGYSYQFWQPWLKNYHGELALGYYNLRVHYKYLWLDLDLREEMTGRR